MTEEQLRELVRQAVARRLGSQLPEGARPCGPFATDVVASSLQSGGRTPSSDTWKQHPSHHIYLTVVNTTDACVIEPSVRCEHCGYCKSHGH